MTVPSTVLAFLIASALGLGFHIILGGPSGRIFLYLATAWVSFAIGQSLSSILGWSVLRLGSLNLLPAVLATIVGLITASLLARPAPRSRNRRPRRR